MPQEPHKFVDYNVELFNLNSIIPADSILYNP